MLTQKETIQCLHATLNGDKRKIIEMYALYDQIGEVPRKSNVCPLSSPAYACIMHHTASKLGWYKEAHAWS